MSSLTQRTTPWTSLRAWRATLPPQGLSQAAADIFAVDIGPSAEIVAGMDEEIGSDPHDFVLIDASGAVTNTLALTAWSIDDELGASVYLLADRALCRVTVSIFTGAAGHTRRVEETVVENLQPVAADEDNTWRFLRQALARHYGNTRVLPAANNGDEVSEEFGRVKALVRKRRQAYGSEADDAILALSDRLGNLVQRIRQLPLPDTSALSTVESVVEAFLLACVPPHHFAEAAPKATKTGGEFATLPGAIQAELREIATLLDVLSRELDQAGERYEWTDARNSAIEMYHAAKYATRAREHIEHGFNNPGDPPRSVR